MRTRMPLVQSPPWEEKEKKEFKYNHFWPFLELPYDIAGVARHRGMNTIMRSNQKTKKLIGDLRITLTYSIIKRSLVMRI